MGYTRQVERALIVGVALLPLAAAALMGGVYPRHQLGLFVTSVGMLGVAVGWRTWKKASLRPGAPFYFFVALAGLCLLQLIPLAAETVAAIQPRTAAVVGYATGGIGGAWHSCLSLDPPGTAMEVIKALALACVAGATALLVRDRSRAMLMLWVVDLGAIAMGLVAIAQYLLRSKMMWWVYAPRLNHSFLTPFVNFNHAAAFYAAILFLHLGLSAQLRGPRQRAVAFSLAIIPFFLVVASHSRGAIIASGVAGIVLLVLLWRTRFLTLNQLGYALAIGALATAVALPTSDALRREFTERTVVDQLGQEAKVKIWRDALPMVRDYPVVGIGRGAFRVAHTRYDRSDPARQKISTHAENWVVHMMVEFGPVLFGLLLIVGGWLAVRYFRGTTLGIQHVIVIVPLLLLVIQNLADFNLEFPGTGFLFAAGLGVLSGLEMGRTRHKSRPRRRFLAAGVWGAAVTVGFVLAATVGSFGARYDLHRDEDRVYALVREGSEPKRALAAGRAAIRRHPSDFFLQYLTAIAASRIVGEKPLRYLNRSLFLNPKSGHAHYQTARILRRGGFDDQALYHYLAAIRRGVPFGVDKAGVATVRGRVLSELTIVFNRLWTRQEPFAEASRLTACLAARAVPQVVLPVCQSGGRLAARVQQSPFERLARLHPDALRTVADGLDARRLVSMARAARLVLARAQPHDLANLERLYRQAEKTSALGEAVHWAEEMRQLQPGPESMARVVELYRRAGLDGRAESLTDEGLLRYPQGVSLLVSKAEFMIQRGALSSARRLLRRGAGQSSLSIKQRIRLIQVRLKVEEKAGRELTVARLRAELLRLNRILKAGGVR